MHRAIETRYKGYRFRSRLEARYAVLFDSLKIEWEYEPEGYQLDGGVWYLPDFFVRFPAGSAQRKRYPNAGYWVEIKAIAPTEAELAKLASLCSATGHHGYVLAGPPREDSPYWAFDCGSNRWSPASRGLGLGLRWSAPIACCSERDRMFNSASAAALGARFEFKERERA